MNFILCLMNNSHQSQKLLYQLVIYMLKLIKIIHILPNLF